MRIAYVCQYQGPDLIASRGIVRNVSLGGNRKIEVLSDLLMREGHEVVVISGGIPADRTLRSFRAFDSTVGGRPDGARVLYAGAWDVAYGNLLVATASAIRRARAEGRRGRFDLILAYNVTEFSMAVVAALLRQAGDVPIVLEYEDSVDMSSRGVSGTRHRLWARLERWIRPRVRGVLAVNERLPQRIGCPNAYVLRGVVSDDLCARGARRATPLATGARPVALFSGSFSWEKGVQRLIDVIPRFAGRIRFVVSGAGPLEGTLRETAKAWPDDLEVLGFLPREELESRLLSADVLLNPHDDESGAIFPFKVIEYLAAGGIVVTTRSGLKHDAALDFCEVASTEDFGAAIDRVFSDPTGSASRAAKGQRWASTLYSATSVSGAVDQVMRRSREPQS